MCLQVYSKDHLLQVLNYLEYRKHFVISVKRNHSTVLCMLQICIIPKVPQAVLTWVTHFVIVVQLVEMRAVSPLRKIFVALVIMDGK